MKFVLFFSCRALFLLSKGMVSQNHSLLIRGTLHIICVSFLSCYSICFSTCICGSAAAADGAEAERGAPSAHAVWDHRRKLAGKPHSEGVPQGFFPGAAGYTLPGCRTGTVISICFTTGK